MIDLRLLRENPDLVRSSQRARGESVETVDALVAADERRRQAGTRFDRLRAEQKDVGRDVARAAGAERETLMVRAKELALEVKAVGAERDAAEQEADALLLELSNVVDPQAPVGARTTSSCSSRSAAPRDFAAEGFAPRDHVELGELLGAIDVERGAKVSGSRFYYLTGVGALLELALLNLAIDQATRPASCR